MYTIKPFSINRVMVEDANKLGQKIPFVYVLAEIDITGVKKKIKDYNQINNSQLTLNNFFLYCFSKTVADKKDLHAIKNWKNQLIVFDDIDVFFPIEKNINNQKVIQPLIIKAINKKSIFQINTEIESFRISDHTNINKSQYYFLKLPYFIKKYFYSIWMKIPKMRKGIFGTAYYSAGGMFGTSKGWGFPIPIHSVGMFLGSFSKVEKIEKGDIKNVEILTFTVIMDHSINDGAELGRFVHNFKKNIDLHLKMFN